MGAVWPWAEENQGLLSVVALAAALALAGVEFWRAERATAARVNDFVDQVIETIDEVRSLCGAALDGIVHEGDYWSFMPPLANGSPRAGRALKQILAAAPPDGRLILIVQEVGEHLADHGIDWIGVVPETVKLRVEDLDGRLSTFRARVAARRRR